MEEVFYAVISFFLIYILYLVLIVFRKKSLKNFEKSTEVSFLVKKYHLNLRHIKMRNLANVIAFTNSFVVASTVFIVSIVENLVLKIIVAMGVMVPLIIVSYYFIGVHYQKKECR